LLAIMLCQPDTTHTLLTQIRAGHMNDMWPDHAVAKPSEPDVLAHRPAAGAWPDASAPFSSFGT
jgi:hypothetical protein